MSYLLMGASSFVVVFLLGLQSRNVVAGRYLAAMLTSAGISVAQFLFVKFVATGGLDALAATTTGGCAGIAAAIWFYGRYLDADRYQQELELSPITLVFPELEPPTAAPARTDLYNEDVIHVRRHA